MDFAKNYTSAQENRIRFDWNGKHAGEFKDNNAEVRATVMEYVLGNIGSVPLDLIRDLFRAETECSKESWGIVNGVDLLAEKMLLADPERYLEDYLIGEYQSFDASIGSAFPMDVELLERLIEVANRRLSAGVPEERRNVLLSGIELFASMMP